MTTKPRIDVAIEGDVLEADVRWRHRDESGFVGNPLDPVHDTPLDGTLFVVVEHRPAGGHDGCSPGHRVTARQLHPNGSYDPNGLLLRFYQSADYSHMILDPKFAGWRMCRTYIKEESDPGEQQEPPEAEERAADGPPFRLETLGDLRRALTWVARQLNEIVESADQNPETHDGGAL
jgi:hypothetical protein